MIHSDEAKDDSGRGGSAYVKGLLKDMKDFEARTSGDDRDSDSDHHQKLTDNFEGNVSIKVATPKTQFYR